MSFVVFWGADVGTNFSVGAVNADGTPHGVSGDGAEIVFNRASEEADIVYGSEKSKAH